LHVVNNKFSAKDRGTPKSAGHCYTCYYCYSSTEHCITFRARRMHRHVAGISYRRNSADTHRQYFFI